VAILEVGLGGRLDATNVIDPTAPSSPASTSTMEYGAGPREHRAREGRHHAHRRPVVVSDPMPPKA
jgi:hypothetical protein